MKMAASSTVLLLFIALLLSATPSSAFLLSAFGDPFYDMPTWRIAHRPSRVFTPSHMLDTIHQLERTADQILGSFMDCSEDACSDTKEVSKQSKNSTSSNETSVQLPALKSLQLRPKFDIQETPEGYSVMVSTPGLQKSDLNVEVVEDNAQDPVLVISGQSSEQKSGNEDEKQPLPLISKYAKFERRIRLPPHINKSSVNAKYENGLLQVTLSKQENKPALRSNIAIA